MLDAISYKMSQPTREWEWEDETRTCLQSVDGEYTITQDPVYGYWTLSSPECDCISQDMVAHNLIMLVD